MEHRLWETSIGRVIVGRLAVGSDLVESIEQICAEREITAAWVSVIGAVRHAAFAYYEQAVQRYEQLSSDGHHEITGFVGNVSLRDGVPFLHAHATFANMEGEAVGGHLTRGCEVFVGEIEIRELLDVDLVRVMNEETGLALW